MNYTKQISTTNRVWCPWGQGTVKLMNSSAISETCSSLASCTGCLGCRSNVFNVVWERVRASPGRLSREEHSRSPLATRPLLPAPAFINYSSFEYGDNICIFWHISSHSVAIVSLFYSSVYQPMSLLLFSSLTFQCIVELRCRADGKEHNNTSLPAELPAR